MDQQGMAPITDVAALHGDFWPEEESVEDFLAALHDWRGHQRTDPAARSKSRLTPTSFPFCSRIIPWASTTIRNSPRASL